MGRRAALANKRKPRDERGASWVTLSASAKSIMTGPLVGGAAMPARALSDDRYWPLSRERGQALRRRGLAMMSSHAAMFALGIVATGRPVLVAVRSALRDALICRQGVSHVHGQQSGRCHHESKNKTDWSYHVALR